jgi:hypothetical protein
MRKSENQRGKAMTTKFRVEQRLCEVFGANNIIACKHQENRGDEPVSKPLTLYYLKEGNKQGRHIGTWNPERQSGVMFNEDRTTTAIV